MLVAARLLSKFDKDFEKISLNTIHDNVSNESWMQYDEKVVDVFRGCGSDATYPTYDPAHNKKASRHLAMSSNEYLDILLHLFKSYVEVYQPHELLHLLSEDVITESNNEAYKLVIKKLANEKNHRFDFIKLLKDWKQLSDRVLKFADTDVIFVPKIVECQNVYINSPTCLRYEEDLENLIKLKETIETYVELGDQYKKWHSFISHIVP